MLRSQHRVYDGSGEVARTQDVWGAEGISGRVKFLPLAWAGMPKTSFRKNSDSPHSLQLASEKPISKVRQQFTLNFEKLHLKVNGWVKKLIVYRYLFLGSVVGVFILSVSLLVSGIVKFSAFPQARHATSRNSGTPVAIIRSPTQRMGDALNALRPQRLRTKAASSLLPHWLDGYLECNSCSSRVLLAHVESANCPVAYQGLKITTSLTHVQSFFAQKSPKCQF